MLVSKPSGSLILLPAADLRSTLLPELKRLVSSSRGLPSALQLGGLKGTGEEGLALAFLCPALAALPGE